MNVLILTSAMTDRDFSSYQNNAKIKPNPSNQNFYSKLIKAIAHYNKTSVVSLRPFVKGMFDEKNLLRNMAQDGQIQYHYVAQTSTFYYKAFKEVNEVLKSAEIAIDEMHSHDFIIVVDSLRISLAKAARILAKKYNAKIVSVLTDNPDNLSSGNKSYRLKVKQIANKSDGFLALTRGLVNAFNPNTKAYIFEGLVEDPLTFKKDPIYDYYFFSGSLYEKYGVKDLIDAFHLSDINSKLVIAGSGPLAKYIEELSYKDYRILYLSQLPKERIYGYQKNAVCCINPRPQNEKLDSESVPSKLLEYIASGVPVISTKYDKFTKLFNDGVTWIEESSVEGIKKTLEAFNQSDIESLKKKAFTARAKAFEFYGLAVQGEFISHFLASINSESNN